VTQPRMFWYAFIQ